MGGSGSGGNKKIKKRVDKFACVWYYIYMPMRQHISSLVVLSLQHIADKKAVNVLFTIYNYNGGVNFMKFIASDKDTKILRNILITKERGDLIPTLLDSMSASKYDYTGKEHGQYRGYFYFFDTSEDVAADVFELILNDVEISNHFLVQLYRKLYKKQENNGNKQQPHNQDIDFEMPF